MVLQTQTHCGLVVRFVICLCLVGFTTEECVPEKCGSMTVSYPFWINNPNCGLSGFHINCTKNSTGMMVPFLQAFKGPYYWNLTPVYYEILEIDYKGNLLIDSTSLKMESCEQNTTESQLFQLRRRGPFFISMSNKFVVIGCNAVGTFTYREFGEARCMSTCYSQTNPPYCGYGCCEISLPDNWYWINFTGGGNALDSHCGFSTILEPSTFKIVDNNTSLFWGDGKKAQYGLRLNWGIGLDNCSTVQTTANYSCSTNAECINSPSGHGHVCSCQPGYQGNGYSKGIGCTDKDECNNSSMNLCVRGPQGGMCKNLSGTYNCSCAKGYIGDGYQNGTGCTPTNSNISIISAIIGSVSSFVGVSLGACGLFWWLRRRRWEKFRIWSEKQIDSKQKKSSDPKGGKVLQKFSETVLETASESFSTILGEGNTERVYEGFLPDGGTHVAIKEIKGIKSISKEIIDEIILLSYISHPHVVKLVGFCMKVKSPLLWLVYELPAKKSKSDKKEPMTLFDHLKSPVNPPMSWQTRLKIATDTAQAVVDMFHEVPQSNFHRDIKSSKILLDHNFDAKIADFSIYPRSDSQVNADFSIHPRSDSQVNENHQFAHKRNVYSFGIVLVELLTSEPATSDREDLIRKLDHIIEENTSAQMTETAKQAKKCLEKDGLSGPLMRDVAEKLADIQSRHREGTSRQSK